MHVFIWMLHMLKWLYTYVISVCSKCFTFFRRMLQVFLSACCICCGGYMHMLQPYVSIVSPCFSMLQQVLLPTPDSRASMRCTRRPCTTRHGPPRWSMQPAQHICMRAVLPRSLVLGHAHCSHSRIGGMRTMICLSLAWGYARSVPSLFRMQLSRSTRMLSRVGAAAARGDMGCSRRRRRCAGVRIRVSV
jgi:hypothetical protein